MNGYFTHLIVINLFGKLSDHNLLSFLEVIFCVFWADEDGFELVDDIGLIICFFFIETSRYCQRESKHAGVLILALEIGGGASEIFEHKEGSQNNVLAVE